MGFLSSLFGRSKKEQAEVEETEQEQEEAMQKYPGLKFGVTLNVSLQNGQPLLAGKVSGYKKDILALERTTGQLAFVTCDIGTVVYLRGYTNNGTTPIDLRGRIEESSRVLCRVGDLQTVEHDDQRSNFRLSVNMPASLHAQEDRRLREPEPCQLINISAGGALIESDVIHCEGEILRLKVRLDRDYPPMNLLGQIIRVEQPEPTKFHYGFLFAQLTEQDTATLRQMIFNIQLAARRGQDRRKINIDEDYDNNE